MSAARSSLTPVSVLVIDDDEDIRGSLHDILEDEGYTVASAAHGALALEVLVSVRPELILLDLNMPFMNGVKFREAQRRDPSLLGIPTIVMTAADRMRERVAALDVDDALAKPIALADLLSVLERHGVTRRERST